MFHMYADLIFSIGITLLLIVAMFASYHPIKRRLEQSGITAKLGQKQIGGLPILDVNRSFHLPQRLVMLAIVPIACVIIAALPSHVSDVGTLSQKTFSEDGQYCVVYTFNPVGVIAEGYRISVFESVETAFFLHFAEIDNIFSVTRRLDVPSHGPVAATHFFIPRNALVYPEVTITSIEPWEHGYLLKTAEYEATFRVWKFLVPDWQKKLERKDLVGSKLRLRLNALWDPNRPITEVSDLLPPAQPRKPKPGEFALG